MRTVERVRGLRAQKEKIDAKIAKNGPEKALVAERDRLIRDIYDVTGLPIEMIDPVNGPAALERRPKG